jgi:hypothetical protein
MESAVVVKDHLAPIIGCLRESKERVGPATSNHFVAHFIARGDEPIS